MLKIRLITHINPEAQRKSLAGVMLIPSGIQPLIRRIDFDAVNGIALAQVNLNPGWNVSGFGRFRSVSPVLACRRGRHPLPAGNRNNFLMIIGGGRGGFFRAGGGCKPGSCRNRHLQESAPGYRHQKSLPAFPSVNAFALYARSPANARVLSMEVMSSCLCKKLEGAIFP